MKRISTAAAAVAVSLLAACGTGGEGAPASSPSPTPSVATGTVAAAAEFWSTCSDEAGDGQSRADIVSVDLHSDGKLVFVTFTLAEQVQPSDFGRISLLTTAFSADGEQGYQFGSIFSGGFEIANFVFDHAAAMQENITNGAVFADGVIAMRYPVADLAELGANFTWYASVSVDTLDVDLCGGPLEEAIPVN